MCLSVIGYRRQQYLLWSKMAIYDLLLLMRQRSGRIISTGIMKAYGPNTIRGDCQK